MGQMRLDKFFSEQGILSRSDTKKELRKKTILVNGEPATKGERKIDPEVDRISFRGRTIAYEPYVYYMLHKPEGVISATEDPEHKTVLDLLKEQFPEEGREIFPIGRLDIDTEGILILTNDGALSHELLSPAKHVEKTYLVRIEGNISEADKEILENGMDIGDEKPTKPAKVELLQPTEKQSAESTQPAMEKPSAESTQPAMEKPSTESTQPEGELLLTITEGRYHQVKRMLAGVGHPVTYLKRIRFGELVLDENLGKGRIRKLTAEEIRMLREKA